MSIRGQSQLLRSGSVSNMVRSTQERESSQPKYSANTTAALHAVGTNANSENDVNRLRQVMSSAGMRNQDPYNLSGEDVETVRRHMAAQEAVKLAASQAPAPAPAPAPVQQQPQVVLHVQQAPQRQPQVQQQPQVQEEPKHVQEFWSQPLPSLSDLPTIGRNERGDFGVGESFNQGFGDTSGVENPLNLVSAGEQKREEEKGELTGQAMAGSAMNAVSYLQERLRRIQNEYPGASRSGGSWS